VIRYAYGGAACSAADKGTQKPDSPTVASWVRGMYANGGSLGPFQSLCLDILGIGGTRRVCVYSATCTIPLDRPSELLVLCYM
jgi:hypothetical protein